MSEVPHKTWNEVVADHLLYMAARQTGQVADSSHTLFMEHSTEVFETMPTDCSPEDWASAALSEVCAFGFDIE